MKKEITIYGLDTNIARAEALGLSKVFYEYYANCPREEIMTIGFNEISGYVYIALECGIQICSCLGNSVEFLVSDTMNGEETFFDTYEEAEEFLLKQSEE